MARIDSLGEASSWHVPEKKKAQRKEKPPLRAFSQMVQSSVEGEALSDELPDRDRRRTIEELLDGVFAAGDELKAAPTIETIKGYRQKVRAFVKYAVDHMIRVEETSSGANIMKRKRFTLVKVIDEKLDSLAASVLAAQREQLAILAQIDEINGLLVDLVS